MEKAVKKGRLKAKLRDERCENCKYTVTFSRIIADGNMSAKPRLYCDRHKHTKKYDSWCRFYEREYRDGSLD